MHVITEIDETALEVLFQEYYQDLTRYAFSITKDQEEAEDVVQRLFVKLWEKRSDLNVLKDAKAYLFRATYNSSINSWNRSRKVNQHSVEDSGELIAAELSSSDYVMGKELEERIELAIQNLPEKCQVVFRLSRFNNKSYKEIAEELDISTKTVENHMGKALKIMRTHLSDYLPQLVITFLLSMRW